MMHQKKFKRKENTKNTELQRCKQLKKKQKMSQEY
jgi:hypothetical protein